ncbi:flagellar brake protein [Echinimonas agarilytica]|uniref:Flagellar brake protein n=1 Tax=Echinimonas agarilytica TaxID=1215918 RepID=A0AA41W3N0_9GAMM|nr:PilZ domain-containing protein [Echinimonas agarilytica]MCM2678195.1 flagellar brake protein [Echinimonas agarilytica]
MIQTSRHEEHEQISKALLACPINCPVDVQVLAGSHVYRLKSRLIGIDNPHVLLLRLGTDQSWKDANHRLEPGQPVVIRMVNESGQCQLLAFRTQLGMACKVPRRWLTVQFPERIESANMREQKRIHVQFGCYIEWGDHKEKLSLGTIIDLSTKGCRIETKVDRPIPESSNIRIRFKDEYSHLTLPGAVRNSSVDASGQIVHGVQLTELSSTERSHLSELMLANY